MEELEMDENKKKKEEEISLEDTSLEGSLDDSLDIGDLELEDENKKGKKKKDDLEDLDIEL